MVSSTSQVAIAMNALGFASDRAVRVILTALCDDSDIRTKALGYLAKLEPHAIQAAQAFPQVKRKATSGLSICVQCESCFDEADNTAKVCQYHNGEYFHVVFNIQPRTILFLSFPF
jgi:hypothetical protein